jgi:GxxExxY protein
MNADKTILHEELTGNIIKAFYTVYNALGFGFLEKVYENALSLELGKLGLSVQRQHPITVYYDASVVGEYYADIIVDNLVIIELKAVESLRQEHVAQLTNYLKATDMQVGMLLNFGAKPEFKRLVNTSFKNPRRSAQSASSAGHFFHA